MKHKLSLYWLLYALCLFLSYLDRTFGKQFADYWQKQRYYSIPVVLYTIALYFACAFLLLARTRLSQSLRHQKFVLPLQWLCAAFTGALVIYLFFDMPGIKYPLLYLLCAQTLFDAVAGNI